MGGIFHSPVLVFIVMFIVIDHIIKSISENRTRRMLIEKGTIDENAKYILTESPESSSPSLKWGLVLLAVGLAIVIGQLVPDRFHDEITFGGMFMFAGLALLGYYFIALKTEKKREQKSGFSSQKTE